MKRIAGMASGQGARRSKAHTRLRDQVSVAASQGPCHGQEERCSLPHDKLLLHLLTSGWKVLWPDRGGDAVSLD